MDSWFFHFFTTCRRELRGVKIKPEKKKTLGPTLVCILKISEGYNVLHGWFCKFAPGFAHGFIGCWKSPHDNRFSLMVPSPPKVKGTGKSPQAWMKSRISIGIAIDSRLGLTEWFGHFGITKALHMASIYFDSIDKHESFDQLLCLWHDEIK